MKFFSARQPQLSAATVFVVALLAAFEARAGGTVGANSFGAMRIGVTGGVIGSHSSPPSGSSVINHGGTGFSIYSRQGVTRVIGRPKVSRKILLPGGGNALAIGDGGGGVYLFGAGGNHRIFANSRLNADDGP